MTLNYKRTFNDKEREQAERFVDGLFDSSYIKISELDCTAYLSKEPLTFKTKFNGKKVSLKQGDAWAKETFDCAFMHFCGKLPENVDKERLVFLIDCGGEGLIIDNNGEPVQGITNFASSFDPILGPTTKRVVPFDDSLCCGAEVNFWADCGANNLFGYMEDSSKLKEMLMAEVCPEIRELAFDMQVLLSVYDFGYDKAFGKRIFDSVKKVMTDGVRSWEDAKKARMDLKPLLDEKNDGEAFTYSAVGHAHTDLAWLWPIRETLRKGARTFTNQIKNIGRYPGYVFGASQAQLYEWIKEYYPGVYAKVKDLAKTPYWECQGATWVEMDSNLIGGESLIRQFFYGKRFFKEEFGEDMKILFLPDSFGYSVCLPQVMKLAGVPYFLTQKLSWNVFNSFPYHSFKWQGLDGSEVLAHMLPENTYNSPMRADFLVNGEKNYKERSISDMAMILYGIGDGGGGPGYEHIERAKRYENLKGLPKVKLEKAETFFEKFQPKEEDYPKFKGELYLERHQGTLTTQSKNKFYNRKCEFAARNYEMLMPLARKRGIMLPISHSELETIWKELLLYQFHDIIPGSSINRVYEETGKRYEIILNRLENAAEFLLQNLFKNLTAVNFNGFGCEKNLKVSGKWYNVKLPALGCREITSDEEIMSFDAQVKWNTIENDKVKVTFKDGFISSLFDKSLGKEFVMSGEKMAVVSQYTDNGDSWDMTNSCAEYIETKKDAQCCAFTIKKDGPKAAAVAHFKVGDNLIKTEYFILDGESSVGINLSIDCKQKDAMLRIAFPVGIDSSVCAFNVQFGHIFRATTELDSFDTAQFEVSGQKFADLSDDYCGISVINDCKYGWRCKHGVIDLNLIRSPKNGPGTNVDQGHFNIKLSLFPHKGKLSEATYREAYLLNNPVTVCGKETGSGENKSYLHISDDRIMLCSIKEPEDSNGLIARFYNCSEDEVMAKIKFNGTDKAEVCDILEEKTGEMAGRFTFKPFELINLRFC